jgi:excisionase family DNA binding protein
MPFSVKQAAKELGVSPTLVYALCAQGKIEHERHGLGRGTIRISEEALARYRQAATAVGGRRPPPEPVRKGRPFTTLDSGRLLEAWRRQGVLAPPPGGDSAPSSGSSCGP